ncbi:nephrin [Anopheles sinensis]|uniref:Nephrin n=1 Tax=Anopheles sinensis TaxID=74873 RepID=A0A084WAS2_ANOSI|nr:nephrin [Anopheles sinensis]
MEKHIPTPTGSEATVPPELSEKAELPSFVIFCIALAGLCLLIVNAGLVAWFIMKKRAKDASNTNGSKTATIEMYAPSSYNDTVTGETLSSVSEKSDAYSNDGSQPDFMPDETRKKAASTYLVDGVDLPPPMYQQDGSMPRYITNVGNGDVHCASPGPPNDGSYYNMNSERYLSYPPMDYPGVEHGTPPLPILPSMPHTESASETLRRVARTMVPPPDVTHHTLNRTHAHVSNPSGNLNGSISQAAQSTPKQPQGILKDPKRSNSSASGTSLSFALLPTQHHHPHQQQVAFPTQSPSLVYQQQQQLDHHPSGLNGFLIPTSHDAPSLGNGLLLGAYEPPSSSSLASYNVSLGYTDADGHLV